MLGVCAAVGHDLLARVTVQECQGYLLGVTPWGQIELDQTRIIRDGRAKQSKVCFHGCRIVDLAQYSQFFLYRIHGKRRLGCLYT